MHSPVKCLIDSKPARPGRFEPDIDALPEERAEQTKRARLGRALIKAYANKTRCQLNPMYMIIGDLITDLLHAQYQSYPDDSEERILDILRTATVHFSAEIRNDI